MTGVPVLLSIGGWLAGVSGVLHGNAVIGAFALLAFAGLATRLVGARWAPLAVLALAFVQPELDVMRATYSEPAGQLILLGGMAIVVDAFVAGELIPHLWPRRASAQSNAPAGGTTLLPLGDSSWAALFSASCFVVRIDAVADLFPLVPFVRLARLPSRRRLATLRRRATARARIRRVRLPGPYLSVRATRLARPQGGRLRLRRTWCR